MNIQGQREREREGERNRESEFTCKTVVLMNRIDHHKQIDKKRKKEIKTEKERESDMHAMNSFGTTAVLMNRIDHYSVFRY